MTVDVSPKRMAYLAVFDGSIGIEGEGDDTEIVVRIPTTPEATAIAYSTLVNIRS